jgi:HSP20 family molecular chaperone IbpA
MHAMNETQSVTKTVSTLPQGGGERPEGFWQPFAAFRNEVDRLFDSFWRGMGTGASVRRAEAEPQPFWRVESGFGLAMPAIDAAETERECRVKAELPGMDVGDVHLAPSDDVLTIKDEKTDEREEKSEDDHLSERRFGSFRLLLPVAPRRGSRPDPGELRQGRIDRDAAEDGRGRRTAAQDRHQARLVTTGRRAGDIS